MKQILLLVSVIGFLSTQTTAADNWKHLLYVPAVKVNYYYKGYQMNADNNAEVWIKVHPKNPATLGVKLRGRARNFSYVVQHVIYDCRDMRQSIDRVVVIDKRGVPMADGALMEMFVLVQGQPIMPGSIDADIRDVFCKTPKHPI